MLEYLLVEQEETSGNTKPLQIYQSDTMNLCRGIKLVQYHRAAACASSIPTVLDVRMRESQCFRRRHV